MTQANTPAINSTAGTVSHHDKAGRLFGCAVGIGGGASAVVTAVGVTEPSGGRVVGGTSAVIARTNC